MRVGKIAGFELRIHWSTLVIFGLLVWVLSASQLPSQAEGRSGTAYLVAALLAGVAFYVALLAHEVSHALLARREGIEVESLTLWVLGGVASLKGEPRTPGADLRIAGVGPAVSLALGLAFGAAAFVVDAGGGSALVVATLGWLAGINVILAVFNMIPAAPLDGGRILRAGLWAWRGDRTWAAVTAARAGEVFGYVLIGLGIISLFSPGVGGLWFLLLGWFLLNAARGEQAQAVLQDRIGDVKVSAVMTPSPVTAPADITVSRLLDEYVLATRHSAFPVVDGSGRVAGLVTLNRLRSVPPERRDTVLVSDVACPLEDVARAAPGERLVEVLPRLNGCSDGRAVVLADGDLVGILTPTDVTRHVEVAEWRARPVGRV